MSYKSVGLDWGDVLDAGAAAFPFVDPGRALKVYGKILPGKAGDIVGGAGSAIESVTKAVVCNVAPYSGGLSTLGPGGTAVAAGAQVGSMLMCRNSDGSELSPEQVAAIQAEQARQQQQRMLIYVGIGAVGLVLLTALL